MTQIDLILRQFFSKNPDVKGARSKGLVNRRALAGYIIKKEGLSLNQIEAVVSALRRFDTEKNSKEEKNIASLFREIIVTTKDRMAIISLEKSDSTLQKLQKIFLKVSYAKNEALKIVEGASVLKLFIDEFNLSKIREIFSGKEIIKISNNMAELGMIFPESAIKTKGIVAYLTSEFSIDSINIIELLTATPELTIYVEEGDLLKAYSTIQRLKEKINE